MPNEKGWYSKREVIESGLPYYIPRSRRWTKMPYTRAILLTKSRCKELGVPVMSNGLEKPSAFRYAAAASAHSDKEHLFIPLYDRTELFENGEITLDKIYDYEIMVNDSHRRNT